MDKPCGNHGTCEVSWNIPHIRVCKSHSLLRVLVREMVKEFVNVIKDTLENYVTNAQLVIIMNPTIV